MHEERKYEIKEPKENLHWISFNANKQTQLLKDIKELLLTIYARCGSKNSSLGPSDDVPF